MTTLTEYLQKNGGEYPWQRFSLHPWPPQILTRDQFDYRYENWPFRKIVEDIVPNDNGELVVYWKINGKVLKEYTMSKEQLANKGATKHIWIVETAMLINNNDLDVEVECELSPGQLIINLS